MIPRNLEHELREALAEFPVVGLIGPRQCGKTTLGHVLVSGVEKSLYLDLEKPSDMGRLDEAEFYLSQFPDHLVVIDEVQRKPELFPLIRALVDSDRRNGRFLLLGSASPDLKRQSAESLAGRIVYHELTPFLVQEIEAAEESVQQLWCRGGFPLSFLASSDTAAVRWRNAFVSTYLERDLPQLGVRIPAMTLRRFWQMIAHDHGQVWNAARIAASLGVTPPAARHYLDVLHDTFMLRQLTPWYSNTRKRLVRSPKVYIRDSGLLHTILGIGTYADVVSHPVAGASFEGFVIEQIAALKPPEWEMSFYRSFSGAEIDLLLMPPGAAPIAVEIKLSLSPVLQKGFHEAYQHSGCTRGYVIYPGDTRYPAAKNVQALPVQRLDALFA